MGNWNSLFNNNYTLLTLHVAFQENDQDIQHSYFTLLWTIQVAHFLRYFHYCVWVLLWCCFLEKLSLVCVWLYFRYVPLLVSPEHIFPESVMLYLLSGLSLQGLLPSLLPMQVKCIVSLYNCKCMSAEQQVWTNWQPFVLTVKWLFFKWLEALLWGFYIIIFWRF